jgi:hypothetical protein
LLLPSAIDGNKQAVLRHGAIRNGRSATRFPNLDGQLLPTAQTMFPELQRLETRLGDLTLVQTHGYREVR